MGCECTAPERTLSALGGHTPTWLSNWVQPLCPCSRCIPNELNVPAFRRIHGNTFMLWYVRVNEAPIIHYDIIHLYTKLFHRAETDRVWGGEKFTSSYSRIEEKIAYTFK